MKFLKLFQFILYNYYVYNVALLGILLVSFNEYWLLTSTLLYVTLLVSQPKYVKDKCYYYYVLFYMNHKNNSFLKVIVKINTHASFFLTCISFCIIDILIILVKITLNKTTIKKNKEEL